MDILKKVTAALLLAFASSAYAGNYATCLLDNLPGVKSGPATTAAINVCAQKFPDKYYDIERGSGRGILGYSSAEQCTLAKSKDTPWQPAARVIKQSCDCLYGVSSSKFDMCEQYRLPPDLATQYDLSTTEKIYAVGKHYREVLRSHPDAYQIMHTDPFWKWMASDDGRGMTLMYGTPAQVVKLFAHYKSDRKANGLPVTPSDISVDKEGKPCTQITEFLGECKRKP